VSDSPISQHCNKEQCREQRGGSKTATLSRLGANATLVGKVSAILQCIQVGVRGPKIHQTSSRSIVVQDAN
jgi:hypothetical protein